MTLQDVSVNLLDGALGLLPAATDRIFCLFGVCSGIPANTMTLVNSADGITALGQGPGVQAAALMLDIAGGPFYVISPTITTAGAAGAVTAPGAGTPPTISVAGAAYDAYDVKIKITLGGTLAVAKFAYSLDGGQNYSPDILTASSYPIPNTNLTLTMGAGTYVLADVYTFTATAPYYSTSSINTAFDAVMATTNEFGIAYFVGQAGGADDAAKSTACAAVFSAVATKMAAAATKYRFARAVIEAPDVADSALITAFASIADQRMSVVAGFGGVTSSQKVVGFGLPRVNVARLLVAQLKNKPIGKDPSQTLAEKGTGPLPAALATIARDEWKTPGLDAARFVTVRTYEGLVGKYVTNWPLFSAPGSDYKYIQHGQCIDNASKVIRNALLQYLSRDLEVNAAGNLSESQAAAIDDDVEDDLRASLVAPGHVTAIRFRSNRTDDVLGSEQLRGSGRIQPKFYPKTISFDLGFTKKFAA